MFATIRNKLRDVGTLSALCKKAEQLARKSGEQKPGSEHFVLAAISLPDGTARQALARLGASSGAFEEAIHTQFVDALDHVGLQAPTAAGTHESSSLPAAAVPKLYHAAASGETLVQRLASSAKARKTRPLLAADVLLAVAEEEFSIAARALRVLGITPRQLAEAANREIALQRQGTA